MRLSDNGQRFIKFWEALKLTAYTCPAGKLTIGFGCTLPEATANGTITVAEADHYFLIQLKVFEKQLESWLKALQVDETSLPQAWLDVAISFIYNAGFANFKKADWPKLWLSGKRVQAVRSLQVWGKPQWKLAPGLEKRRCMEAVLLSTCLTADEFGVLVQI